MNNNWLWKFALEARERCQKERLFYSFATCFSIKIIELVQFGIATFFIIKSYQTKNEN